MDITQLLAFSVKNKASDLHLSAGLPPMIRVHGDVRRINVDPLDHKTVHAMVYDIMSDSQRKAYEEFLEVDFSFEIEGLARFRVNAFNQYRGAAAVFRTIPSKILTLEQLNAPRIFADLALKPRGLVLVTGPTGSGKSTTLAGMVNHLNETEYGHILTVEDPIEYELAGVGQTQVNAKIDLTFAKALRAILRQDPDVIMIGEIRDFETAQIAIQASLTGHLVLATLHTNDASSAVTRLIDMGVEPFLLSSSLLGVLAQRLVRKIDTTEPSGYRGRTGIFEMLVVDDTIRAQIHRQASEAEIRDTALAAGMRLMRDDGERLVREGITTPEEVLRVTRD